MRRARRAEIVAMDLELAGKVAVVTGASRGIGLAITRALVDEGAKVIAGARRVSPLAGLPGVSALALDLSMRDAPAQLVARAVEEHGRVDVLVNNVGGVHLRLEGFLGTSDEDFEWALQINFFAALRATRAAVSRMLEQGGGGAIVNVATVNALFQPDSATIDSGAAKAALVNVSKSLAQEFGARGIRVNNVSPGPVASEASIGAEGVAAPVGRYTTAEEVATLVVLLASKRTANVTGASFVIDGGLIKTV